MSTSLLHGLQKQVWLRNYGAEHRLIRSLERPGQRGQAKMYNFTDSLDTTIPEPLMLFHSPKQWTQWFWAGRSIVLQANFRQTNVNT